MSREELILLRIALLGALFLSLGSFLGKIAIENFSFPWQCPFKTLTGYPCPGCGMTDALKFFLKGSWREAFSSNPHLFPLIAFSLGLAFNPQKVLSVVKRFFLLEIWLGTIFLWWLLRLIFLW